MMKRYALVPSAIILQGCIGLPKSHEAPDFGGEQEIRLVGGTKSSVSIERVIWFDSSQDFLLTFRIFDPEERFSSLTLGEITPVYGDGESKAMQAPWTEDFDGRHRRPVYINIDALPFRHSDVTVAFSGFLTTANGERMPFSATEKFSARVGRYWTNPQF